MSLILTDGFDHYNTTAEMAVMWNGGVSIGAGSTLTIDPAFARFPNSGNGLHFSTGNPISVLETFNNQTTIFFSCSIYLLTTNIGNFLIIKDGSTAQVTFSIDIVGQVTITTAGGTVSSALGISQNMWHRLEFKVVINNVTGSAECKVDGVSLIAFSGNTRVSSTNQANNISWGTSVGGANCYVDDALLYSGDATAPNGYLGDLKCVTQYPSANGATNNFAQNAATWTASTVEVVGNQIIDSNGNLQIVTAITSDAKTGGGAPGWSIILHGTTTDNHVTWTLKQIAPLSNFNFVNEAPPDGDNSYLSDSTVNDEELYSFPPLTGAIGIIGIAICMFSRKDDAGTRTLEALAVSGGTPATNGSFPQSNIYAFYEGFFNVDPNTSVAWTEAGVNAAQFGVKVLA